MIIRVVICDTLNGLCNPPSRRQQQPITALPRQGCFAMDECCASMFDIEHDVQQ